MKSCNYVDHDIVDYSQKKGNNQDRSKSSSKDNCSYSGTGGSGGYVEHEMVDLSQSNKKNRK